MSDLLMPDWLNNPLGVDASQLGHNARRTCKPPTEAQLAEDGSYASERPVGVRCAECPGRGAAITEAAQTHCPLTPSGACSKGVEARPACGGCKVRADKVLREVANEPATRLLMLREMLVEANKDLEEAMQNQEPQAVYEHGEAVAACEELIKYLSK